MRAPRHTHVIGLDILRLFAAVLVVCYHFGFWNWTRGQPLAGALPGQAPAFGASLHFGWVGVEVFFVISGFVIAYTASDANPAAFLRGRFLRLAPASWIAATLVLAVHAAIGTPSLTALIGLYVETLVFWPLNAIDGVWWTLGIEIDFYLLAYILIRKQHAASLEAIMVTVGLLSGLFWVAALTLQSALAGATGIVGQLHYLVLKAEGNRELQLLLIQHGCLFALGVVAWRASTGGLTPRRALTMAVLAAACLLEIVGQNGIIERAAQLPLSPLPALMAWGIAMALLTISVVFNAAMAARLGRAGKLVRFAGLATYPLYLVHDATGIGVTEALAPQLGSAALGVGVASAFVCAAIVTAYAEPWLRGVLSNLLPTPPRRHLPLQAPPPPTRQA